MGCGASASKYRQDAAVPDVHKAWQPIAAWEASAQDTGYVSATWADPVHSMSAAQISLGGEWYCEVAGSWYPFNPEISAQLLVAWYCGETSVEYTAGEAVVDVDFASCLQTDRKTGSQQRIGWVASGGQEAGDQVATAQASGEGSPDSQSWNMYGEDVQQELLSAWAAGKTLIYYSHNGCDFEVDFNRMVERNLTTGAENILGLHVVDEAEDGGGDAAAAVPDAPKHDTGTKASTGAKESASQQAQPQPQKMHRPAVSDGRFPIDTGQSGRVEGRPRTYVFKAAPSTEQSRPRREKKWSLAPGQKPRNAGNAPPPGTESHRPSPPPQGRTAGGQRTAPPGGPAPPQQLSLPTGIEWPGDVKARRVAETLFKDMASTRMANLDQRRQAYRAACLSWHPDKNPKHQELAKNVFQFLQALKAWYFA